MKYSYLLILVLLTAGCATVPNGGYNGDISKLGTPGDLLAEVKLGQGLLVATAHLDKGRSVNLQVTKEDVTVSDPLYYARTLTIGHFSKILGSGFTKKKNIFYRKRIWYEGKDYFDMEGDRYLVEWKCDYKDPLSYIIADMYNIRFRSLGPTAKATITSSPQAP